MSDDPLIDREIVIRRLRRSRSRSHFLRTSGILFGLLVAYAWMFGGLDTSEYLSDRRVANLQRFLAELRPHPLQGRPWDTATAAAWASELLVTRAVPGAVTTLAMSIAAITMAGVAAVVLAFGASRSMASPEPYLPHARHPSAAQRAGWGAIVWLTRVLLIFLRAIPEYMWAFIALAVVGPNVWAAVFALAIHNAGILGKLYAEVVENLEPDTMAAVRALGGTRLQIAVGAIGPAILPRVLLLFFYRWETAVREATVLGMLGIVSLGFYVQDARVRQYYDVMLALIVSGSVVVLLGDLVSAAARGFVRRAA